MMRPEGEGGTQVKRRGSASGRGSGMCTFLWGTAGHRSDRSKGGGSERRLDRLLGTGSEGPGCWPRWGIHTVATGVVLQLVRVLRVSALKPPSSGTRAKGWSHLEAPGELGATVGDRERVGRPWKPPPCQRMPCWPLAEQPHPPWSHSALATSPTSSPGSRFPLSPHQLSPFQTAKSSLAMAPGPRNSGASVHLTL